MNKFLRTLRSPRSFAAAALIASSLCTRTADAQTAASAPAQPAKPAKPRELGFDLSASLGGAVRLGDAPLFDVEERVGGTFGLGVAYLLQPVSIGLQYDHMGLGREESGVTSYGTVSISRKLDTLWASVRVRLGGIEPIAPYLGASLGAVWQSARVSGIYLPDGGVGGGQVFSCSATDSANLAMRVATGVEVPLTGGLQFLGEGSFDAYRLSSDVFEGCAPGAGTTTSFVLRVGFLYRFDLDGDKQRRAAPPAAAYVR